MELDLIQSLLKTLFICASKSISKKNYEKENSFHEKFTKSGLSQEFLEQLVGSFSKTHYTLTCPGIILIRRSTREKIKTQISVINSFNQCLICKRIGSVQIQQESGICDFACETCCATFGFYFNRAYIDVLKTIFL